MFSFFLGIFYGRPKNKLITVVLQFGEEILTFPDLFRGKLVSFATLSYFASKWHYFKVFLIGFGPN